MTLSESGARSILLGGKEGNKIRPRALPNRPTEKHMLESHALRWKLTSVVDEVGLFCPTTGTFMYMYLIGLCLSYLLESWFTSSGNAQLLVRNGANVLVSKITIVMTDSHAFRFAFANTLLIEDEIAQDYQNPHPKSTKRPRLTYSQSKSKLQSRL